MAAFSPYEVLSEDLAGRLQVRRFLLVVTFLSLVTNVLLAAWMLLRSDTSRTVVLAPGPSVRYVASETEVSPELLERFSMTALSLVANLAPGTGRWAVDQFLEQTAPEVRADLAAQLEKGLRELEGADAAVSFFPEGSLVEPGRGRVCLRGRREMRIGRAPVEGTKQVLCLTTTVRMGRLWITGLTDRGPEF